MDKIVADKVNHLCFFGRSLFERFSIIEEVLEVRRLIFVYSLNASSRRIGNLGRFVKLSVLTVRSEREREREEINNDKNR